MLPKLRVKIFADGADKAGILEMYEKPYIHGFTTNPTLMKQAGIKDYKQFALDLIKEIPDRPLSFEVFADDFEEMKRQAFEIHSWGQNVYVKIPVYNTKHVSSYKLIDHLVNSRVKVNVTALMTLDQVREVNHIIRGGTNCYISVFAGRIADTGRDPVPIMSSAVEILREAPNVELIWASPREVLNIFQADAVGCHIITVSNDILSKLIIIGKDLNEYCLDTVKMFYHDALNAGYSL